MIDLMIRLLEPSFQQSLLVLVLSQAFGVLSDVLFTLCDADGQRSLPFQLEALNHLSTHEPNLFLESRSFSETLSHLVIHGFELAFGTERVYHIVARLENAYLSMGL